MRKTRAGEVADYERETKYSLRKKERGENSTNRRKSKSQSQEKISLCNCSHSNSDSPRTDE